MKLSNLLRSKQTPVSAPLCESAFAVTANTMVLFRTPEEKEALAREVVGLRRAIQMMGLDPKKVVDHVLDDRDATCKNILFRNIVVNDQSLRDEGLAESSFPKWTRAYNMLKPGEKDS